MSGFRWRRLWLVSAGLTFVLAHVFWTGLGRGWLVWLGPFVGSTVTGVIVGEWGGGAWSGGYGAGIGGFLFVAGNFWFQGINTAVTNGLLGFVLFAVFGIICGGIAGFLTGRLQSHGAEDEEAEEAGGTVDSSED